MTGLPGLPEPSPTHDAIHYAPHPAHRHEFDDGHLARLVEAWTDEWADEPIGLVPTACFQCPTCGGTGLFTTRSAMDGHLVTVTCPACGGES